MKRLAVLCAISMLAVLGLLGLLLVAFTPPAPSGAGAPLRPGAVPAAYRATIEQAAASCHGVPAAVLAAQLQQESGWRPDAVSPVGAVGLAQFMPGTWTTYGVDGNGDGRTDPRDPIDAIWSAAHYDCALRSIVRVVPGDAVALTLAAYNAGPYAVLSHVGVPPFRETRGYVRNILGSVASFTLSQQQGADGLTPAAAAVRQLVISTFGVRDIGGFATEGHVPGSDHYTGRAIDVMLTPIGPTNTALGWRIATYLQSNAARLGITYLIWQARIWSVSRAGEGWRPYQHPGGGASPTLMHMDHVHVSVL